MNRRIVNIFIIIGLFLIVILPGWTTVTAQEKAVSVGNKNFTEQYIIGQMIKQLLEADGFTVEYRPDLTSMALRAGMKSGEIDICADYTGTAWMIHLKRKYEPGTGHRAVYENVKKADKENGFLWLDPIWNNNSYALASWPEFTEKHGLKNLSDLAALYRKKDGEILTFINFEFSARPDGLYALEDVYDFNIARSHL
ncbi:MAG: glycine betaine ABC transporter substrate-binding protein, partial [Desulfococcaceae bacterium]